MPIVFAASCMPCPTDMANAEHGLGDRKPRFSLPGWPLRKIHRIDEHHEEARG